MEIKLYRPAIKDLPEIPPSKSYVIRFLIAAAFADRKTELSCSSLNDDIKAAAGCLNAIGADIEYKDGVFYIDPVKKIKENAVLYPGESASVLRFLIPVICFFGRGAVFITEGRLSERPLSPLRELLEDAGAHIRTEDRKIYVSGRVSRNEFNIRGDISSQFITGLMFMLSFTGGTINIVNRPVSRNYIEMTSSVLADFGCRTVSDGSMIRIEKCRPLISPGRRKAEKDWSGAAVFLCAGAIGDAPVKVEGLDTDSVQGDRMILDLLRTYGAETEVTDEYVKVSSREHKPFDTDASDIPDLVPVLAVAALRAEGQSVIRNVSRLRTKESDRLDTLCSMISTLGGKITTDGNNLYIEGSVIKGGRIKDIKDHRIIMAAALCSLISEDEIIIENAETADKSYPGFFSQFDLR